MVEPMVRVQRWRPEVRSCIRAGVYALANSPQKEPSIEASTRRHEQVVILERPRGGFRGGTGPVVEGGVGAVVAGPGHGAGGSSVRVGRSRSRGGRFAGRARLTRVRPARTIRKPTARPT